MTVKELYEQIEIIMQNTYKGFNLSTEEYTRLASGLYEQLVHWNFAIN